MRGSACRAPASIAAGVAVRPCRRRLRLSRLEILWELRLRLTSRLIVAELPTVPSELLSIDEENGGGSLEGCAARRLRIAEAAVRTGGV